MNSVRNPETSSSGLRAAVGQQIAGILRIGSSIRSSRLFFTTTNRNPGQERYRRAGLSASTSLLAQGLMILTGLVSVPLTVHYLGQERYGVWLTISSLLIWMAMTDFGLAGNALVNVMAEAHGNDDRVLARQYAASAFWALTLIAGGIGTVALVTFKWIPWREVFRASANVSTEELHQACALMLGIFVLMFPLNMLNSVYSGYQDGFIANAWTVASNTAALVSLVIVTQMRGDLPHLVFALAGSRAIVGLANAYYLFTHRYPWLIPRPSAVEWKHVKRLLRLGSKYLVTQLAGLGIYQSQPILITQLLGPSYVLLFVVAQRVITLPHNLVFMATTPLVSAYSEAKARHDWKWIIEALRNSLFAAISMGFALTAIIALWARPIIRAWVGPSAVPNPALILWLSAYTLVGIATLPPAQMLNGLERIGKPALALAFCAVGTIGFGVLFVRRWGLAGLALGMTVSLFITYGTMLAFEVRSVLRTFSTLTRYSEPLPEPVPASSAP